MALTASLLLCTQAQAEQQSFTCQRFKSSCTGKACEPLLEGLQKDTEKKIFTATKTEIVEYKIDGQEATETLSGEQAQPGKDRPLQQHYKFVENKNNVLVLANKDAKDAVKEEAVIDLQSGFYHYYLIHTDGSIKDIPVGEPYTAYFGWCENMSPPHPLAAAPAPATLPAATP